MPSSYAEDWEEEEAQGEDLLSDEECDKEPEDNLDYKVRQLLGPWLVR